eukprot:3010662-Prymnesium_polylepis.2
MTKPVKPASEKMSDVSRTTAQSSSEGSAHKIPAWAQGWNEEGNGKASSTHQRRAGFASGLKGLLEVGCEGCVEERESGSGCDGGQQHNPTGESRGPERDLILLCGVVEPIERDNLADLATKEERREGAQHDVDGARCEDGG